MDTQKLLADLDAAFKDFNTVIKSVDSDQFNTQPFEGSWTAGQCVQHVLLSVSGFEQLIGGPAVATEGRQPDQNVEHLRSVFLNFDIKMQSPEFIKPPVAEYNKDEQLEKLTKTGAGVIDAASKADLSQTVTDMPVKEMANMTKYELLSFVLFHTQRHTQQLKNITEKLAEKKEAAEA